MSTNSTFTILSSGAPLVEVDGQGPYRDLPGGLAVADGVPTISPVDLLNAWLRVWRVDAPVTAQAAIALTDTPYGAQVDVRRCTGFTPDRWWRRFAEIFEWHGLGAFANPRRSLVSRALRVVADQSQSCVWRTITEGTWEMANARGGDLVVVTFVTP